MRRILRAPLAVSLLLPLSASCSDDDDTDGSGAVDSGAEGVDAGVDAGAEPPELEAGWNELKPGGETICSRGSEYAYFVRKGSVNKVVIDFIGGGACWNAFTCGLASTLFSQTVDGIRERILGNELTGLQDDQNPANPFKDWYHVVIPYCTGDVHWGDAVTTYNEGMTDEVTINHKGAVNSRAVLDWVYDYFPGPEQILVTGCSAGSYGSALWSAHVMQHYRDARIFQFGDSGAGVITDSFFEDSFPSWRTEGAFPAFIPALDPAKVDILNMELADLYVEVAKYFPDRWLSQYNTTFDENQHLYYMAMGGGNVDEWSTKMLDSIDEIELEAANFSAFIAPGEQHCILPYANFYTVETNGVKLTDWLQRLVDEGSVESAKCQGTECDGMTP